MSGKFSPIGTFLSSKKAIFAILGIGLLFSVQNPQAMKVVAVRLQEMVGRADRVFVGTCLEAKSEVDPNRGFVVTTYTFSVVHPVKGNVEKTVTFRQYGGRTAKRRSAIDGLPVYRPGQEVVLFLKPVSEWGLTSPVGIFQGCFGVTRSRAGRRFVVNSPYSRHLSGQALSRTAHALSKPARLSPDGRMDLEDFIELIVGIVEDGE